MVQGVGQVRVLHVSGYLPPHYGGVESHVDCLCSHLVELGVHVEAVASEGGTNRGYRTLIVPPKLKVIGNPVMLGLARLVREGGYDLVHLHTPPQLPPLLASRACRVSGTPYVVTYHCDGEVPHPMLRRSVPAFMRLAGNRMLDHADRVIATTEAYAVTSPHIRDRPYVVVPSGVDLARFPGHVDGSVARRRLGLEGRFVVGFVGRLVDHKGVDILLRAVASMRDRDVGCLVVGDGPRKRRLERMARRLGLEGAVFTGQVDDADLVHHYAAMDVLVLPSRSREEAFGLTLLEAMACGRPVVVSRIPGPSEVAVDGSSRSFQPGDHKDLSRTLEEMRNDHGLLSDMSRMARSVVERTYDWRIVAPRVLALYEEVLA